ncbi:hypothetical protein QPK87_22825 [Kamptonema cortianum]|nr:hypothetical protein [Oscillatoria laete-virens]MDK3159386.1 hypothetical protein [Kamptonema cortianum]MDL5050413.1 hypothetical protein [Oscillatoria amoena NRMC-F 0135]MDL5054188.1 hypothetical protein [Oscillatoria laete-virens NRMC-F 0139]
MPKIQGINHQDAVQVFQKVGYRIKRQAGHIIMTKDQNILVIPRGNPINPFTMGGIARTAGLTPEEFKSLL